MNKVNATEKNSQRINHATCSTLSKELVLYRELAELLLVDEEEIKADEKYTEGRILAIRREMQRLFNNFCEPRKRQANKIFNLISEGDRLISEDELISEGDRLISENYQTSLFEGPTSTSECNYCQLYRKDPSLSTAPQIATDGFDIDEYDMFQDPFAK